MLEIVDVFENRSAVATLSERDLLRNISSS